jgi:hypothetical protein
MEKRSRRRIRDLVTHLAFQGLAENEIGCARISIVAKSTNALFTGRIQKRPNKGRQLPAEVVEGRASPKGKSRQPAVVRTLSRVATSIRLAAVRRTANGLNPFATDVRPEGGDPMQARRGYRIGANPTTQGVGERDDGPHSNKPTRRNAW